MKTYTKTIKTQAPDLYAIEFTDTFAGEANYCWAARFVVRAANIRQAVTSAKKHRYASPLPRHEMSDYCDGSCRIDIKKACVCAFISRIDPEDYSQERDGEIVN